MSDTFSKRRAENEKKLRTFYLIRNLQIYIKNETSVLIFMCEFLYSDYHPEVNHVNFSNIMSFLS